MKTRTCAYALLVALVAAGLYGPTVANGFVWDDGREITGDRFDTHRIGRLATVFVHSGQKGIYRPLKVAYLTLMYRFFGDRPRPYHLMCILFHASASALVFLAGRRMVPEEAAGLGALIFAVHPVHAEAVAWASGFLYPLAALFLLGGLMVNQRRMGRYADNWGAPSTRRRTGHAPAAAESLLYILSIMSAESGVAFLFVIPLYHLAATGNRRDLRGWAAACGPAAAALIAYAVLRLAAVGAGGRGMSLPGGLAGILRVDVLAAAAYARIVTTGEGLCVDRGWPLGVPLLSAAWIGAAALCALLVILGVILWRRTRAGAFLYWATVLSFLPVSNIVPTSMTPIADRYAYLPSIFSCILIGLAFERAIRTPGRSRAGRTGRILASVLMAAVLLYWIAATAARAALWGEPAALWADTVRKNPDSVLGNYNLGLCLDNAGDFEAAAALYSRTLELQPAHSRARNNLGALAARAGRTDEALRHFRAAVESEPENAAARFNLGVLIAGRGEYEEGLMHLREAARLDPGRRLIDETIAEIEGKAGR